MGGYSGPATIERDVNVLEPIDRVSGGLTSITTEHHEMHEGDHYFYKSWLRNDGIAGTIDYFAFITPELPTRIHAKTKLGPDVDYTVTIYRDGEIEDGTPLDGVNNDGDSLNVALLEAVAAPTIIELGDYVWGARNGGGKDPVGVAGGFNYEIIAASNTLYIFELVKNVAQIGIVDVDFWWYEHIPTS